MRDTANYKYDDRKTDQNEAPKIQYNQGKPIFSVDWDSESMESYESEKDSDPAENSQDHLDEYGNLMSPFLPQKPIVLMQQRRNGFLE